MTNITSSKRNYKKSFKYLSKGGEENGYIFSGS